MDNLRAAVVGCGRMGSEPSVRLAGIAPAGWLPISHVEALNQLQGVDLVGIADINEPLLRNRASEFGIEAIYTDYKELLADLCPHVLTIATRTPQKADIIRDACLAGVRAIYVEKPLGNSIGVTRDALSVASEAGVSIGYGVNRRYHGVYRHARALVLDGEVGEVSDIVVEHGRAQLLWSHPHSVDLALYLLGDTDVECVQATLEEKTVNLTEPEVVDSDPVVEHAHFRFTSGVNASLVGSGGLTVRVGGSRGTLTVHADGSFIQLSQPGHAEDPYFVQQQFLHDNVTQSATVTAFRELVDSIEQPGMAPISQEEILTGTRMLMGCVHSHLEGGRRVSLDEVPENLTVTGIFDGKYA